MSEKRVEKHSGALHGFLKAGLLLLDFQAVLRLVLQCLLILASGAEIFQGSVLFISLLLAPNQDCCCCFSGSVNLFWSPVGSGSCCGSLVCRAVIHFFQSGTGWLWSLRVCVGFLVLHHDGGSCVL